MYATRRAADGWQSECSGALAVMGVYQVSAYIETITIFVVSVHDDDPTAADKKSALDWFETAMKEKYEL